MARLLLLLQLGPASAAGVVEYLTEGTGFRCAVHRFDVGQTRREVSCWGQNDRGQLGQGDTMPRQAQAFVLLGGPVQQLASGGSHSCALLQSGEVKCWGANSFGQLGTGDLRDVGDQCQEMGDWLRPVNLGALASEVACGSDHSCARLTDGRVKCWGSNLQGQVLSGGGRIIGSQPREMGQALAPRLTGTRTDCAVRHVELPHSRLKHNLKIPRQGWALIDSTGRVLALRQGQEKQALAEAERKAQAEQAQEAWAKQLEQEQLQARQALEEASTSRAQEAHARQQEELAMRAEGQLKEELRALQEQELTVASQAREACEAQEQGQEKQALEEAERKAQAEQAQEAWAKQLEQEQLQARQALEEASTSRAQEAHARQQEELAMRAEGQLKEELRALQEQESAVAAQEQAADQKALRRSSEQLEEAQEALHAAQAAAGAAKREAQAAEEAKRQLGHQALAGDELRAAATAADAAPPPVACNVWSLAAEARAQDGVSSAYLCDRRTAEARLRARCLVGSAELHVERADHALREAQAEQSRLGATAGRLAEAAQAAANAELVALRRRLKSAEGQLETGRRLQEAAASLAGATNSEPQRLQLQVVPGGADPWFAQAGRSLCRSFPNAQHFERAEAAEAEAAEAAEAEAARRQVAAEVYAQARLHRNLESAVAEARRGLRRREEASQHRAEAEVARGEAEELQICLARVQPDGPSPGFVAASLRHALGCWAKRRRLCDAVLQGVASAGMGPAADVAERAGMVSDESAGCQLPAGRFDPLLGRVPLLPEEEGPSITDHSW
ncbi:unnamed protein product [Effrenium voratum]|nr:unnamed protein product [Effrenium voratum]